MNLNQNLQRLKNIQFKLIEAIKNKGIKIDSTPLLQDIVPLVKSINTNANIIDSFIGESTIDKILLDDSFNKIGNYSFSNCSAEKLKIKGKPSIQELAFKGSKVKELYLPDVIKGDFDNTSWGNDLKIHYKTFYVNFNVDIDNCKIIIENIGEVNTPYNTEQPLLGDYIIYKESYLISNGVIGDTTNNKSIDISMVPDTIENKNTFKLTNTNSLQTVDFEIIINGCKLNFKQQNEVTLYFDKKEYEVTYKITAPLGYKDQQGTITLTTDYINNFTLEEGTNYTLPQQGNIYYISDTPELKRYIVSEGYGLTIDDYIQGNNDYYGVVAFNNPFDTTKLYCDVTGYNGVSGMYIGSKPYKPTKEQLKNKETDSNGTWLWTSDEGNKQLQATIPTGDCFLCLIGYGEELLTSYVGLYLL